jgi:hypothetical protein
LIVIIPAYDREARILSMMETIEQIIEREYGAVYSNWG